MKLKISISVLFVFAFLLRPVLGYAQSNTTKERVIKGLVLDATTNEPIIGVNVVSIPEQKGTTTDVEGKFTLSCNVTTKFLQVSFIGYETAHVPIGEDDIITILLNENSEVLSEIIVTGIQTIERGRATGSYNIVDPDNDLKNIYSTNITEKLEGAVPGLYVDKDNNMTIRGLSSLNASTKPLIVVDGFPLESSELNLNPNDIEQISILKDAASASIWGIRATNGVIVITTKKGKKGKLSVSYSGNLTIGNRPDWSELHILPSDQYVAAQFSLIQNIGIYNSVGSGMNELEQIYYQYNKGNISLENAWAQIGELGKFNNAKQITENFYRPSFTQQHNISLTAGSEKSSTYLSMSYDQDKTTLVGNDYDKFNFLLNNDFHLHKTFSIAVNLRGTYRYSKNNGMDMTSYEPWKRILNDDGTYYNEQHGVSEAWDTDWQALGLQGWHKNSLEMMRMNNNRSKEYNLSSSLRLNWTPIKGLDISVQGNYEFGQTHSDNFYSQNHYFTRQLTNTFTEVEIENGRPVAVIKKHLPTNGGIKNLSDSHLYSYSVRDIISYTNSYKDFEYKILVGNEIYSLEGDNYSNWLFGFNPDLLTSQSIDMASLQEGVNGYNGRVQNLDGQYAPSYAETLQRYVSYFGTASITYKKTYDLFGSIRLDQTNLLTNSNKFRNNPSWSIGGKWNIKNENFFKADFVNQLNLRVSYGLTGNIDKTTGPDIVTEATSDYNIPSLNYLIITNPANPALGWEKTYTWNLGVDYSFLGNRLLGSIDFYHKLSKGLLTTVDNDPTTGWSGIMKNSATVKNFGLDLTVKGNVVETKNILWEMILNLAYNHNRVTKLNYDPSPRGVCRGNPVQGQPIGTIATIRYGGLDENGEPTFLKKDDETRYSYDELHLLEMDDLKYEGSMNPPIFGSFTTNFRYKDFTLGMMFTYRFGGKMRLPSPSPTFGLYSEWFGEDYRWIDGADNSNKWVPRLFTESDIQPIDRRDCLLMSDRMVDKSDVIYLKSIRLTYDVSRWVKRIGLTGGSISLGGENLAFWAANRYNLDPDQMTAGSSDYEYVCHFRKSPRFVMGLNIEF